MSVSASLYLRSLRAPLGTKIKLLPTPTQQGELSEGPALDAVVTTLMPTPDAYDKRGGSQHPDKRRAGGHQPTIADVAEHLPRRALLPTPVASDTDAPATPSDWERHSPALHAMVTLFPTPVVNDMGAGKTEEWWDAWVEKLKIRGGGHGKSLDLEARKLLPTPTTQDGKHVADHGTSRDPAVWSEVLKLLPTPTQPHPAHETRDPQKRVDSRHQTELSDVVRLLPTPTASDEKDRQKSENWDGNDLVSTVKLLPTPTTTAHATRSGSRSEELLLPGVVRSLGAHTSPPSDAGSESSDE